MKWTIVYFDDLPDNIELMKDLLSSKYEVIGCSDINSYNEFIELYNPHAYLLDVHMPLMDGHTLYNKILEHPLYNGCPVLFISGDISDENVIRSHNSGAIDFLPRDLSFEEVEARITNKIRLYQQTSLKLSIGNLVMDLEALKVYINYSLVELTLLEMRILSAIFRAYPDKVPTDELIKKVWGTSSVRAGTIHTHVTNLRPKLKNWDHSIKSRSYSFLVEKI